METQLLPGTILNNRYRIIKNLSWRSRGGVYEAWDFKVTDQRWIIKEIIPAGLSPFEMRQRSETFHESLEVVKNLEHEGLAKVIDYFTEFSHEFIVMEFIDGVTLKQFMKVIKRLKESQALDIGLTLCDIIEYLHDRPHPLIFESLDYQHVMFDYDKTVKYIGYDMEIFFTSEKPHSIFADSSSEVEKTISQISTIMAILLGGGKGNDLIPESINASPQFVEILNRSISPHQKAFSTIGEYRTELLKIRHPEEIQEPLRKSQKSILEEIHLESLEQIKYIPRKIKRFLLGQKPWMLTFELISVIIVLFALSIFCLGRTPSYKAPVGERLVYVTAGKELLTFEENDLRLIDSKSLGKNLGGMYFLMNKETLLVSDSGGSLIYRVNPRNNDDSGFIRVDKNPASITDDGAVHKNLFVLHPATDNLSILNLDSLAPEGIMAVGVKSLFMACEHSNGNLILSNRDSKDVMIVEPLKNKVLMRMPLDMEPGKILLSPDGSKLYVADAAGSSVVVLDMLNNLHEIDRIDQTGGKGITDMLWDKEPGKIWLSFGKTHNLSLVNTETKSITISMETGKTPLKMAWDSQKEKIWLIDSGTRQMMVILPYSQVIEIRYNLNTTPSDILVSPVIFTK